MHVASFEEVAGELLALLDQQVATITGRSVKELSSEEVADYEARQHKIIELHRALSLMLTPAR